MFILREFQTEDYQSIWQQMKDFTLSRKDDTADEIWILEHHPVYTQGQAGKPEHILHPNAIPIIQTDRGGQITYHGPGQIIVYFMINCQKRQLGVKQLVSSIEDFCIDLLASFGIKGEKQCKAPGVYVQGAKIASLGLRIKNHCSYHGLALNVDMNLKPFQDINPCGYQNLRMTQMLEHAPNVKISELRRLIKSKLPDFLSSQPQGLACKS